MLVPLPHGWHIHQQIPHDPPIITCLIVYIGGVTYVIALPSVNLKDRACVEECPVQCSCEGQQSLYIHPDESVDCGACQPACPVEAMYYGNDLPAALSGYLDDNARFVTDTLPRREGQLGSPGGAAKLRLPVADTAMMVVLPQQEA
jgi:NAD-dependent dihydropyrimidine dehydrogenase PreA subunit